MTGQSTTVIIASTDPVAVHPIYFRVEDFGHNLDPTSVSVSNLSLGQPAEAVYMSPNQMWNNSLGKPEGAYWKADLPFQPGDNEIQFTATDGKKNLSQTVIYTRQIPDVVARIASPSAGSWNSHALIHLDGSTSEGPPDMETRWVFLLPSVSMSGLHDLETSGLETDIEMPEIYRGVMARLVVATPGNLPADLYTYGLPCSLAGSGGQCDSIQIQLNNACCTSSGCEGAGILLQLQIQSPTDGDRLSPNASATLAALASGAGGATLTYRWFAAPFDRPDDKMLLTPPGVDGTGFDPTYRSFSLNRQSAGLGLGTYILTAEAGLVDDFSCSSPPCCVGSLVEDSVVVRFAHTLSAVAPGQAFPGDTVRVYGETFTPGEDILVRIDDDSDHSIVPYEMMATATDGHWVEITLPSEIAEGQVYRVAVAAPGGEGESTWKQALEIIYPSYDEPGTDDPSCTGVGQEAANPIVPGQTVTGNFCGEGDTDYFYFPAAAGTTFDIALERVDDSLSVYDPTSIDPELFIINPDGVAPGAGYANDNSADDTNASLTGFTTTQTGLYGIACRTSRASGQYRLTVHRTGTPSNTNFSVTSYGDRAVAVVPQSGSTSSASLQALAFDPQGLPAAGAAISWENLGGTTASEQISNSGTMGLGAGTFTLEAGGSAILKPTFNWPDTAAKSSKTREPVDEGPPLGYVRFSPDGLLLKNQLPAAVEAHAIVQADRQRRAVVQAGGRTEQPSKLMAACTDPTAGGAEIAEINFPAGAVSIDGFDLELTDESGVALGVDLPGFTAGENHPLGVRLIAHCRDAENVPFDAPMMSAPIALGSSGESRSDLAGGIVNSGSTCQRVVMSAGGELTPFTHEVGKRAILNSIDESGDAHFFFTELLSAGISLKTEAPGGGWTIMRGRSEVEVRPRHAEPAEIRWLEPQNLHELIRVDFIPTAEDPQEPTFAEYIEGPQFYLLDEWGNLTPLWGRDDSRWHNQPSDEPRTHSKITSRFTRPDVPQIWPGRLSQIGGVAKATLRISRLRPGRSCRADGMRKPEVIFE